MGTLFLVLKILGILLLAVLGLIVLLLLAVLLVPLRYRASGSFLGTCKGRAGISWFLHILSAAADYADGNLFLTVRVFGVKVFRTQLMGGETEGAEEKEWPAEEKRSGKEGNLSVPAKSGKTAGDAKQQDGSIAAANEEPVEKAVSEKAAGKKAKKAASGKASGTKTVPGKAAAQEKVPRKRGRPARILEKIRSAGTGFRGKWEALMEKKDRVLAFVGDEKNQRTFRLIARQVFRMLRHILPQSAEGWVTFGFEDPYMTGQILQYISPFYAFYARQVTVTPVFDRQVMEGSLSLRGRIRAGTVLVLGLCVLKDQNFRRLIRRRGNRQKT